MMHILSTISLLLLQLIIASASSCGICLPTGPPYEDTYLVTRLWSIQSSSWSDLDVIEEFNKGFAPIVTNMPGFIQYTAAQNNNNSSTVYFSDMYLNTRLYKVVSTNVELTPDALRNDTAPLAAAFSKQPGFINYVGTITEDEEYLFFSNVFDDLSSAQTANGMGVSSANNTDEGDTALLAATEGKIIFDYICTEDNANVNSTLIPSSPASTSGATTGRRLLLSLILVTTSTLHTLTLLTT